ncbi:hypothetical protein Q0F98_21680 [Paenibacillus amylolyticus]|nr:hypothetical protein Q0F98_21680 [Paenibacillus amylolyticus]
MVEEIKQQSPYYRESAYGLLMSLYIELLRIHASSERLSSQDQERDIQGDLVISPVLEFITKII